MTLCFNPLAFGFSFWLILKLEIISFIPSKIAMPANEARSASWFIAVQQCEPSLSFSG